MKVILVHKFYYPRAGAERSFFDLKDSLEKNGHEVIPFAMHHPFNLPTPFSRYFVTNIDFENPKKMKEKFRAFGRMLFSVESYVKFKALLRDEKPDLVHIHNIYHHLSPSLLYAAKRMSIPVVQTVHDYKLICPNYKLFSNGAIDESCKGGNISSDILRKSVKGSLQGSLAAGIEHLSHRMIGSYRKSIEAFIAPSVFVKDKLVEFGMDGNAIHVIPHYAETPPKKVLPGKGRDVIYVGRLAEEKGVEVLIRALKHCTANLRIVGTGPREGQLKKLVCEFGLSSRVFFHGFLPHRAVNELIGNAALVVVPSLWHEVFGYSCLEGLSHGKPVLASRVGALPELLNDVDPYLLFDAGNDRELGEKIGHLLKSPDKRREIGERAMRFAAIYTSPARFFPRVYELYQAVMTRYGERLEAMSHP